MRLAHQLAFESDRITADMVEVTEFPQLVQRYRVSGVPKTIINDAASIEGRVPEPVLLEQIFTAANPS